MERNREEIKDFLIDEVLTDEGNEDLLDAVKYDKRLNEEEVQRLYDVISLKAKEKAEALKRFEGVSLLMEIDSLTIYTDAFVQYCRGRQIKL